MAERQHRQYLSIKEITELTSIPEIDILKKINETSLTDETRLTSVYCYVSSKYGEWNREGKIFSMGSYEGYLEVHSEHLNRAYHHLLNSIKPEPFPFLKCNPKAMSIFAYGFLEAIDIEDDEFIVRHSWQCINVNGVFNKIRIVNRKNFKSHDFSLTDLLPISRGTVQVDTEESLESEYVSAIKEEEDDDDESIECAETSEIEATRTLEIASHYVYADYLPSSSETFTFDFSNLYLDRKDALKMFPQIANGNIKLVEVEQNQTDAKSKKLELLVCDLVLTFLKISEYAINGKKTDHRKRTEEIIVDTFLKDFASLLKKDSKISKDAFYRLFKDRFIKDSASADGSKSNRQYSFPIFLSEVLENNQEYIAPYNFIKQDQSKK